MIYKTHATTLPAPPRLHELALTLCVCANFFAPWESLLRRYARSAATLLAAILALTAAPAQTRQDKRPIQPLPERFWPTFPAIPDTYPNTLNSDQVKALDAMKVLRQRFLELSSPDWKPELYLISTRATDQKGKLICEGEKKRTVRGEMRTEPQSEGSLVEARFADISCPSKDFIALASYSDGQFWLGGWDGVQKGLYAWPYGQGVKFNTRTHTILYEQGKTIEPELTIREDVVILPSTHFMLARTPGTLALSPAAPATLWIPGKGTMRVSNRLSDTFYVEKALVTFVADDGSYELTGRVEPAPSAAQSPLGADDNYRIRRDSLLQINRALDPSLPPGTYTTGEPVMFAGLPKSAYPTASTLATYAEAAMRCTDLPPVPSGWLPWAPDCGKQGDITMFEIKGNRSLHYMKDGRIEMLSEKGDRVWVASAFTADENPQPIGEASRWENNLPVETKQFPEPAVSPSTDSAAFEAALQLTVRLGEQEDERLAKLIQQGEQEQAQLIQNSLNQNAEYNARHAAELAENEREWRQQQAESDAAMMRGFQNAVGIIANSQNQVRQDLARTESARQAVVQEQNERVTAQHDATLTTHQRTANQAARLAAKNMKASRPAVTTATAATKPTTPQHSAPVATAKPQTSTLAQQRAENQAAAHQYQQQLAAAKASHAAPKEATTTVTISDGSGSSPKVLTKKASDAPDTVRIWPEGLAVCKYNSHTSSDGFCHGPMEKGTLDDDPYKVVGYVCGHGGNVHEYGVVNGFHVWGCGYGIDLNNPKIDPDYARATQFDAGAAYDAIPTGRRDYHCSDRGAGAYHCTQQ